MASKHLKQNPVSRLHLAIVAGLFAVAFAAITAAMAVHVIDGNATVAAPQPAAAQAVQQPVQQPLSQEGRLVAVSPNSVTAQSSDGFARTYVIDAQTNAITQNGSSVGGAGTTFAVDDEVAIVGIVRDGTAVATAVAAKQVANLNGPPMDAV